MRLISIEGQLWQLSLLQASSESWIEGHEQEINEALLARRSSCHRGIITFKQGDLRVNAKAIIEIVVHGLPHRHSYEVYYNKKGHYCMVQKERVFLNELPNQQQHEDSGD